MGYSRSPKILKGALIQFSSAMILPIPNVIIFQYNPESLTRTLTGYSPESSSSPAGKLADLATKPADNTQPPDPAEAFNLQLYLDATDALEHPATHPVAVLTGVADRLAALEMLLYPI